MSQIAVENKMQLGQLLLARDIVTAEQIEKALAEQKDKGHRKLLGELLVEMGYCTENQIASALAQGYGVPYAQVTPKICDPKVIEILPREFLEEYIVLPLFKVNNVLTIAVNIHSFKKYDGGAYMYPSLCANRRRHGPAFCQRGFP